MSTQISQISFQQNSQNFIGRENYLLHGSAVIANNRYMTD